MVQICMKTETFYFLVLFINTCSLLLLNIHLLTCCICSSRSIMVKPLFGVLEQKIELHKNNNDMYSDT